jgi:predicted DNA-binding transcriptional regulator AlpA
MSSKPDRRERGGSRSVDRILTIAEFAKLNRISVTTLYRIVARGCGPKIIKLSVRRVGIRESDAVAWQDARIRMHDADRRRKQSAAA